MFQLSPLSFVSTRIVEPLQERHIRAHSGLSLLIPRTAIIDILILLVMRVSFRFRFGLSMTKLATDTTLGSEFFSAEKRKDLLILVS